MALTRITTFPAAAGTPGPVYFKGGVWFVALNDGGVRTIYWSADDRVTWTSTNDAVTAGVSTAIQFIEYAGGYWFLRRVGTSSVPLLKSTDLTTWTTVTGLPAAWGNALVGLASDGATWVAVADTYATGPGGPYHGAFAKSTDLTTWTEDVVVGATWNYGNAKSLAYHDGRWFLVLQDSVVYSPIVRSSVVSSTDLVTWAQQSSDDDNSQYFEADSNSLYLVRTTVGAGRISRWDKDTNSFGSTGTETVAALYWAGAGLGGSIAAVNDDDSGWSTFTNISQYTIATGWTTQTIGTPTAPVVLASDNYDWGFGNDGILFVSRNGGTNYADFFYPEILLDSTTDEVWVTERVAPSESVPAYAVSSTIADETATGDETPTSSAASAVTVLDETIEGDEVLTEEWLHLVQDAGAADDLLTLSATGAVTVLEDGEASESATLFFITEIVDETLPTAEELTAESATWLYEAATGDDLLTGSATSSATLTDAAAADETTYLVHGQDVNDETATADETLAPAFTVLLVDETITAGEDLIEGGAPAVDTLVDTATADDLLTVQVASIQEIIEVATATDALLAKDAGAVAWVLNPDTTAAYWYSNFQFTDIVQVDSVVLGVGPDGLCILTGSTDNGDAIDATVTTGLMDFGTEQKKRVKEFRYGYTSDGKMNLTIEVDGQSRGWRYPLPKNLDGLPRNGRVLPGQGLNSRYWRLTLENSAGSDFDVKSSLTDIITHTRRL